MKSKSQITSDLRSPRDDNHVSRNQRTFPLTDHSYQPTIERRSSSTHAPKETRGLSESQTFRRISSEFFGAESTANYVMEVVFFAWITCIAAWPMGVTIYQLTRWMI